MSKSNQVIDFSIDYYGILGIDRKTLLPGSTYGEKQSNSKIIHEAYRKQASMWHPDVPWSSDDPAPSQKEKEERFKQIIKAHTILSDQVSKQIYDRGKDDPGSGKKQGLDFQILATSIGEFRPDSIEATIGTIIYNKILSGVPQIEGTVCPETEGEDDYIWEFYFKQTKRDPLTLSIVRDENEVLRLTSAEGVSEALPFKIHLFFPSHKGQLTFRESFNPGEQTITGIEYADHVLFESTNLDNTVEYISSGMLKDIKDYILES